MQSRACAINGHLGIESSFFLTRAADPAHPSAHAADSLHQHLSPPVKCRMSFLDGDKSSETRRAHFSGAGQSPFDCGAIAR
jgi:hypothetical protein